MGMLLPVWKDLANPGDKYTLNSDCFIRTEPVETAAFERMKHHVDFFFVPLTSLYQFWPEFFFGTNDINTNFITDSTKLQLSKLPHINFLDVLRFETYGTDYNNWFVTQSVSPGYLTAKPDPFGIPYIWNLRRLYDLFGYGTVDTTPAIDQSGDGGAMNLSLFNYLAYHKIFYSHYNNSNFYPNRQELYNVDSYVTDTDSPSGLLTLAGEIMSTIHYRPYRKDYFTNIFPTPQFSSSWANALSQNPILGYSGFNIREITSDNIYNDTIINSSNKSLSNNSDSLYPFNTSPGVGLISSSSYDTPNSIRALFAYDRLLRVTGMAGNHYHEQLKAHFGVTMPKGVTNEAYFLGSCETDIVINEIVATASTSGDDGSVLGDLAGKGYAQSKLGQDIKFTAPCHGIMMAISSIEPLVDYASMSIEQENRYLSTFDFYHPELDDLGMQPAYNTFFNSNLIGSGVSNASQISGWQYRYSELKTKYDVVNEGFWNTGRKSWVGYKQNLYGIDRSGLYSPTLFDLFYIAPQYTNTIFAQQVPFFQVPKSTGELFGTDLSYQYQLENGQTVPSQWNAVMFDPSSEDITIDVFKAPYVYGSDNFLINLNILCYKTSLMSVHSLPNFKF